MQQRQGTLPAGIELPQHLRYVKQLGRGAYGTVYLCDDVNNGTQVAVKHVRKAAAHGKSMIREIRLLARLRHENLLHLLDFVAVPSPNFDDVYLVLPYMPADLHKVIQSRQALTEKHIQVIVVQILRAMEYLHGTGVAHRDLKPANILLSADCKLKVCDFGLAKGGLLDDGEEACGVLTEYVVTRWYRAPEVMLLPKQYTSTVDLWSVGCILGEILGRKAMFPGKNHIDMICKVAKTLGTPSDAELSWLPKDKDAYAFLRNVCPQTAGEPLDQLYPCASEHCLRLLRDLLSWDPNGRPSAAQALEYEYLRVYQPKQATVPPEPFDWSFDGFRPTSEAVKERVYWECALYHPEILERDGLQPLNLRQRGPSSVKVPPTSFTPPSRAASPRTSTASTATPRSLTPRASPRTSTSSTAGPISLTPRSLTPRKSKTSTPRTSLAAAPASAGPPRGSSASVASLAGRVSCGKQASPAPAPAAARSSAEASTAAAAAAVACYAATATAVAASGRVAVAQFCGSGIPGGQLPRPIARAATPVRAASGAHGGIMGVSARALTPSRSAMGVSVRG
mmetsp:Transcript_55150/g.178750  ORF Transcript_55150/g.178750 Transcript_55150/m.178750 type:complete len:566 (-) Transcript_55150:62-1759(-)